MAIPFDGEQPALMVIPHGPTQPVLTVIPHLLGTLGLPSVVGALVIPAPTGSVGRAPEEIANLRSNWDAYLNMTDDGTWLTSIVDTGPDARNMTPNKASGMGVTTFAVGADAAARLPGNPLVTSPDSHPSSMFAVAGVNDFTIMATIPTEFEPTTGAAYFTWRMATGGLFGLIINKGSTPGYIRVQGSNGTTTVDLGEIDIGINSSNGAAATAILFVRRAAGVVRLDAWYDNKLGGGVQRPEQQALVDVLPTPIPVTSQHLAGRGSITQPWQGDAKAKFHQLAWWDRALDYDEVVDLAKYMGLRCAIEGIEAAPAPSAAQATHWHQPSAADAEYLTAPDSTCPNVGTIIAVINPTAIGSTRGGILRLNTATLGNIWLGILPGSPDVLQGVTTRATTRTTQRAYTSDAALYDGTPKVAWCRWSSGGTMQVGWGKPSAGLTTTSLSIGSFSTAAGAASLGNVAGANSSIGGDYEVSAFARLLSDAEIDGVVDALSLAALAPGDAFLYPRPAPGVFSSTVITDPSTQVQDETAHTWAIATDDGTSPMQAS